MSGVILEAAGVAVSYDGVRVLAPSSFSLHAGEMVAVVGPNGAGKSSLFKALAGFVDHEGDVIVHGEACHHLDRQAIAYIPQQSEIDLRFPVSVADVVLAGRRRFHGRRMRATDADHSAVRDRLAQVGLADAADASLSTLSGGQVQRVMIARALAQEADVLLLDEALSGVDARRTEGLIDLFDTIRAAGSAVVVSSHDLGLVRTRFPRCLTVNGRIVGDGPPTTELDGARLEAVFASR